MADDLIFSCVTCRCAHMDASSAQCPACQRREVAKGLNYMEKPHRYTPGPGGNCLFCSHTQRWHTENRPKTPAEVEQEKKDRAIQEKNDLALGSALMLTALPTEQDTLQAILADQKMQTQAEQIAGAPLQDPNDPATAAGVTDPKAKALLKKALAQALAERLAKDAKVDKWLDGEEGDTGNGAKPADKDAPLVNVQYDEKKKSGGISEPERKKLADEGVAMEDGTFPIRDENDLKVALTLWGKATDPHAAREHIIVRAVELGLEDSLPQNIKDHQSSSKKQETDAESDPTQPQPKDEVKKAAYAITKSANEKRYTLGPMYIPDRLDAHNEFATAEELQKAVWDYTRSGDRRIRLQHNTSIVAGECVEVMSWPEEMTVSLSLPTGSLQKASSVTFPAGTTYMGIVWEPWAWELVKKGKISGLSMGGTARRTVMVEGLDLPTPESDPHILKYSPTQPRDKNGRWTDGDFTTKPGNWFDRHVMGVETVRTEQSPDSVSPSTAAGRAAATLISGRPYTPPSAITPTSTSVNSHGVKITHMEHHPENSDTSLIDPRAEMSALALALERLATNLGLSLDSLFHLAAKKMAKSRGLTTEQFDTLVAKHGQKGTPNYPHRNANSKVSPAGGADIIDAVNAPHKGAVNPRSYANRYAKPDPATGEVAINSSTGAKITEVQVNEFIASWAPPAEGDFSPEISDAAQSIVDRATHNEPFLTAALQQQSDAHGGKLVGLEYKLKGKGSMMRKIRDKAAAKGITPQEYADKIGDSLRYTMILPASTLIEDSRNVLRGLRDSGYTITSVENTWARGDAYSGLHVTVVAPDGLAAEVQFHTQPSFDTKMANHVDYDVFRDPTTPVEIAEFLSAKMAKTWQGVKQPTGWKSFGELLAF